MIKVIGKRLLIPNKDRLIGFEGDNRTGRLYFSFRKDFFTEVFGSESDLSVSAKLQAPGASKAVAYVLTPVADLSSDKESVYELEILSGMVQAVGEIKLQLILLKDMGKDENQSDIPDLEWNSETQSFYACDSLDFETYSGSAGSAQLDAFKELLSEIGAKATSAAESAAASLSHMNEAARYSEEAKAAANEVDGHIANTDNPHEVTAAQVGAYTKTETDGKIAEAVTPVASDITALEGTVSGKLDKVSSDVRVYPGVYATDDVDGTPYLITATSDLSYIGNSRGYIPLYETGGQLKTATPTAADSAANKGYVDGKIAEAVTPVASDITALEGTVAGKLDKVSSYVRVYPGVYATDDVDGTPHLITATSDLGYIGNGSGYIPLYAAGGQLKTETPTADDSAANKGYVDGKIAALTKKYELIETITLTEATSSIERSVEPDGTAYNFKKLIIYMNASLTDKTGAFGVNLWDGTTLAARHVAFGSDMTKTKSDYIMEISVEDGILHQTTPARTDYSYLSSPTKTAAATFYGGVKMMDKISKIQINQYNGIAFTVGTVIKIYGVRA